MTAPIVFFDIAGPDLTQLQQFYSTVFKWDVGADGRFATRVESSSGGMLPASLRQDPAGIMFYIGVDDVTARLNELQAAGGTIEVPRFEVPGVVVLGLFKDPAGNRLGLVEMAGGKPKVP
jgi:predicted enzyme related to lactoylglutathione lyase